MNELTKINLKGITVKQTKDGDIFICKVEIIEDTWEEAKETAEYMQNKLKNILIGQSTLV